MFELLGDISGRYAPFKGRFTKRPTTQFGALDGGEGANLIFYKISPCKPLNKI